MDELLYNPFFGISVTLAAYCAGGWLCRRIKGPLANPLILGSVLVILFLLATGIPMEAYLAGADLITLLLPLATAVLAVSIYRNRRLLGANLLPVLAGCLAGAVTSVVSVLALSRLFGLDQAVTASLLPKSVTTPIALELSQTLGGIPSLTVVAVILTGTPGIIIAPLLIKWLRLRNPVVIGLAMGTSAHAIGTSKAVEMGEIQGAMSGIAIGITGIFTVIIALIFF